MNRSVESKNVVENSKKTREDRKSAEKHAQAQGHAWIWTIHQLYSHWMDPGPSLTKIQGFKTRSA
jgi:uncharacterized membrane-anchored protein